jgi:hypothetical protein
LTVRKIARISFVSAFALAGFFSTTIFSSSPHFRPALPSILSQHRIHSSSLSAPPSSVACLPARRFAFAPASCPCQGFQLRLGEPHGNQQNLCQVRPTLVHATLRIALELLIVSALSCGRATAGLNQARSLSSSDYGRQRGGRYVRPSEEASAWLLPTLFNRLLRPGPWAAPQRCTSPNSCLAFRRDTDSDTTSPALDPGHQSCSVNWTQEKFQSLSRRLVPVLE